MKKSIRIFAIVIILFIALVIVGVIYMPVFQKRSAAFSQDETAVLNNPMQGFYVQTDTRDTPNLTWSTKSGGMSLVLMACNLNGYQAKPLDDAKLLEIKNALESAKAEKVDVVFRAAYGFAEGFDTKEPLSLDIVLGHIGQMSETLKPYSDILLCVQAGMLGPWGEWHTSSLLEGHDENRQAEMRNAVVKAWIDGLPDKNIVLQLRRPEFVRQAADGGLPIERLGFHNDALLANDSDMGTYTGGESIRRDELNWVYEHLPLSPFGGEMPQISAYTEPSAAVEEFKKLRLTYLNSGYNTDALDAWKAQKYNGYNAYDYIKNHMGSRLFIREVTAKKGFLKSGQLKMNIVIENAGFALPHPALQFWITIQQGEQVSYIPVKAESPRTENGSLLIHADVKMPDLDSSAPFSVGLRAGFGTIENGRPFLLANQSLTTADNTTYFAEYAPHWAMWKWQNAS